MRDVEEKQHLLLQASKAMDLLDQQKSEELERSQFLIDELNQKIESLEHEVSSLQNALVDSNKSNFANDTGYADFVGAVDPKEIECQRKMQELNEIEINFRKQMNVMNEKIKELQAEKKQIELQASQLLYDNDEMKDKMSQVEKHMVDQVGTTYSSLDLFPKLIPIFLSSTKSSKLFEIFASKSLKKPSGFDVKMKFFWGRMKP